VRGGEERSCGQGWRGGWVIAKVIIDKKVRGWACRITPEISPRDIEGKVNLLKKEEKKNDNNMMMRRGKKYGIEGASDREGSSVKIGK